MSGWSEAEELEQQTHDCAERVRTTLKIHGTEEVEKDMETSLCAVDLSQDGNAAIFDVWRL